MITFVARTSATTTTASLAGTIPAGVIAEDVLVWVVVSTAADAATPSGWTLQNSLEPGTSKQYVYTRVAVASTPAPTITLTASGTHMGHMLAFRGVEASTPVNAIAQVYNSTAATSHTCPTVTTTQADTLIVRVASTYSTNASRTYTWAGLSNLAYGRTASGYRYMASATQAQAAIGATGTSSATFSESLWSYGATIALTPRRRFRLGTTPKKLMLGTTEVQIRA